MISRREAGFILPFVLVSIAILALVTTVSVALVQRAGDRVARLQDLAAAERALANAEAETLYVFLTGRSVQGGVLTDHSVEIDDFFGEIDEV